MAGFVKVYGTILQSSIWLESPTTKVVWITMLALADAEGIVRSSVIGLAHSAHVRTPDCERALTVLASNDRESQTKTDDGKRIEGHDGGWLILNYRKYRELRTEDQIAAAVRQKRKRERDRDASRDTPLLPTDKEADKDKETTKPRAGTEYPAEFNFVWNLFPRRKGGSNKAGTFRQYNARLGEGHAYDTLVDGTKRFMTKCIALGWVGTPYVMAAERFFGRDLHFLDDHAVEGGSDAELLWAEMKRTDIVHDRTPAEWTEHVEQIVGSGAIDSAKRFQEAWSRFDLTLLRTARSDKQAVEHIAQALRAA